MLVSNEYIGMQVTKVAHAGSLKLVKGARENLSWLTQVNHLQNLVR